jgi:hypothetical protein
MPDLLLDIGKDLAAIDLIPAAVQVLGRKAELNNEIARKVLRLDFAPLLPPQPDQRLLVIAHNDPGIRAANKRAPLGSFPHGIFHIFLRQV